MHTPSIPEYSDPEVVIDSLKSSNNYDNVDNESINGNNKDNMSEKIENENLKDFDFSCIDGYNLSHVYREYNKDADTLGNTAYMCIYLHIHMYICIIIFIYL
jgi:hypothetical protein